MGVQSEYRAVGGVEDVSVSGRTTAALRDIRYGERREGMGCGGRGRRCYEREIVCKIGLSGERVAGRRWWLNDRVRFEVEKRVTYV